MGREFEQRRSVNDRPRPNQPVRHTLPDVYHKCVRCLASLKVEGHGLPKGWTVVLGRSGKHDEVRCEQCVIDVRNGSPEQL